jgi:hypothetical protein
VTGYGDGLIGTAWRNPSGLGSLWVQMGPVGSSP